MGLDTVVAIATAPGVGGVGIVRLSGPDALRFCQPLISPRVFSELVTAPRTLVYTAVKNPDSGEHLDTGMLVYFKRPQSYTADDIVEFHLHGNPVILKSLLSILIKQGARIAAPGEFTKRAYLAGKMDLLQAESVLATVEARSEEILRRTVKQLEGYLSRDIATYREQLLKLLAEIEVSLDYPDEFGFSQLREKIQFTLDAISEKITFLLRNQTQMSRIEKGVYTVLVGLPNAGKSSLLNALLQEDRALVSAIPGTTRDRVEAQLSIKGIHYQLVDTAGLREASDVLESMGVEKTHKAMAQAALVLYVFDAVRGLTSDDQKIIDQLVRNEIPLILVRNKVDLLSGDRLLFEDAFVSVPTVSTCTQLPTGINTLIEKIHLEVQRLYLQDSGYNLINQRQKSELERTLEALLDVEAGLSTNMPIDLWTIGLREAIAALGALAGTDVTEDLLDNIFSGFCVGK